MKLVLEKSVIRSWRLQDETSLVRYANNRNVSRNLRDHFPFPYSEEHAREFLASATNQSTESHYAIESDGEAIGGIGVRLKEDVERHVAELGYWLGEPFWGRGIMTEAVIAITEFAIREFLLHRIEAWVFEWNATSARVLEKAGFQLEGILRRSAIKHGKIIDRKLYAFVPDI